MSQFATDIRTVTQVLPHPNADRLEIAMVNDLGYRMVVGKGEFHPGDRALYIPLDAVLPDTFRDQLGLQRNRIKTVKLRGEISQGLLVPLNKAVSWLPDGTDLGAAFGVTKYDPEEVTHQGHGTRTTLPAGLSIYDIENAERYLRDYSLIMSGPHVVTEKLEGTNYCAVLDENDQFHVCSRRHALSEDDSVWWRATRELGIRDIVTEIKTTIGANHVAIYGELVGPSIQKNYYGIDRLTLFVFDLKLNHHWQSWNELCWLASTGLFGGLSLVPSVALGYPYSVLKANKLREGVVVRTAGNRERMLLKVKNKDYLLKEE